MTLKTAWTQFRPSTNQTNASTITDFVTLAGVEVQMEKFVEDGVVNTRSGDQLNKLFLEASPEAGTLKPLYKSDMYSFWLSFCIEEPAIGTNHWCEVQLKSNGVLIEGASQTQPVLKSTPDNQDMIFNFGVFITKDIFENGIDIFITTDIIMNMNNFILKATRIYNI